MSIKNQFIKSLSNLVGFSTKRKIVVIESDDWGSIRMPSNEIRQELQQKGIPLGEGTPGYSYNLYDTLASEDDLSHLFEVLSSFRDKNGRHPVFTGMSLVANPDFEKIRQSGFQEYHYESFTETLKREGKNSFKLWKEGEKNGIFWPEFHGREHLNVPVWLRSLQMNDENTLRAFDSGIWGFKRKGINYQAAFDLEFSTDLAFQKEIIADGLKLFKEIHGREASLFVPPNGPFNESLEEVAAKGGIKYMSAAKIHKQPLGNGKMKNKYHWLGQKNKHDQIYITRNAFFEPSNPSRNWNADCLNDIQIAFRFNKPVVISTHRVNYIGSLDVNNRDKGLRELGSLFKEILNRWPDVEFMTSTELGNLMSGKLT
ncbi:polysaccharide (de)acetylase [Flavobacterium sp. MFBS3-15]|uniref:polysaccharide (de)acetylase n=1 Tax=Flavobacterium sp. MFBS3-15 TaxID=2989816 RepID=UPI002235941A|nr:polysaccharide (de)acetylase [Flavobacterium sp. MFBS3-15]MCW4469569.1 polysaccharide (de)acetylase [Flavobacterium sp. MFBS3-15]